jgi:hypothetical protein
MNARMAIVSLLLLLDGRKIGQTGRSTNPKHQSNGATFARTVRIQDHIEFDAVLDVEIDRRFPKRSMKTFINLFTSRERTLKCLPVMLQL